MFGPGPVWIELLQEVLVFQVFFANEKLFSSCKKKPLHQKKKKKISESSILVEDPCWEGPACHTRLWSVVSRGGRAGRGRSPVPGSGEPPGLLAAGSQARRALGAEAAQKLGDAVASPSNCVGRRPLPQEDVTICCAGAHCQGDKIFMATLLLPVSSHGDLFVTNLHACLKRSLHSF